MYVPRPGAVPVAPLMAGLGLGERPGAFKIKYDLRQMDVESAPHSPGPSAVLVFAY